MGPSDRVDDGETLYRRVPNTPVYADRHDGKWQVSIVVFQDRTRRPSVDRAHLNAFDPERTKQQRGDGIVSVIALQVRAVREKKMDAKGKEIGDEYVADVEPVPLPGNPAHAEIFGRPPFDTDSLFKRVCRRLVRLSRWECEPGELS